MATLDSSVWDFWFATFLVNGPWHPFWPIVDGPRGGGHGPSGLMVNVSAPSVQSQLMMSKIYRQTDILITILHTSPGGKNNNNWSKECLTKDHIRLLYALCSKHTQQTSAFAAVTYKLRPMFDYIICNLTSSYTGFGIKKLSYLLRQSSITDLSRYATANVYLLTFIYEWNLAGIYAVFLAITLVIHKTGST